MLTNRIECVIIYERQGDAGVAQLVEQLICNQQVGGSNPSTSSSFFQSQRSEYGRVPEWPKGADCKSVVVDFGGSNPPSSTRKRHLQLQVPFSMQLVTVKREEQLRREILLRKREIRLRRVKERTSFDNI